MRYTGTAINAPQKMLAPRTDILPVTKGLSFVRSTGEGTLLEAIQKAEKIKARTNSTIKIPIENVVVNTYSSNEEGAPDGEP